MNKKQRYECQECGRTYFFNQDEWETWSSSNESECQECGRNQLERVEKIVNLTPHDINIECQEAIKSSGICRVSETIENAGNFAGIQLIKKSFSKIENLPERMIGVKYVVSIIVAMAAKEPINYDEQGERDDLLLPGEIIRDSDGKIIGCKNLAVF
jgi:DNA-directed RNA polymerase subunit RPC12/RpoP